MRHTYELCSMSAGEVWVLLVSNRPQEIKQRYLRNCKKQYLRIRVDGRILTIREADEFCGCKWGLAHDLKKQARLHVTVSKCGVVPKSHPRAGGIAVEQLDRDGNVIGRFASMADAAEANHIQPCTVQRRCKNKPGRIDGMFFRYADGKQR